MDKYLILIEQLEKKLNSLIEKRKIINKDIDQIDGKCYEIDSEIRKLINEREKLYDSEHSLRHPFRHIFFKNNCFIPFSIPVFLIITGQIFGLIANLYAYTLGTFCLIIITTTILIQLRKIKNINYQEIIESIILINNEITNENNCKEKMIAKKKSLEKDIESIRSEIKIIKKEVENIKVERKNVIEFNHKELENLKIKRDALINNSERNYFEEYEELINQHFEKNRVGSSDEKDEVQLRGEDFSKAKVGKRL